MEILIERISTVRHLCDVFSAVSGLTIMLLDEEPTTDETKNEAVKILVEIQTLIAEIPIDQLSVQLAK